MPKDAEDKWMKAVCYEKYGPPEVLQLREIPKPSPRKDEILVKIRATSVTSSEAQMRQGKPYYGRLILGLTKPSRKVLGLEFAGEVVGRGSEVRKFGLGDRVFGFTGFRCGGYAQYICVPENESVILMPGKISFEEAVALVDGPTTALFFLNKAKIKESEKVLIYGASGSIGTAAVQIAVLQGAEVTAVCSAGNFELVKSLGAHKFIDYRTEDFAEAKNAYDVIFDTVGKTSFAKCKGSLRPGGKYLVTVIGFEALAQTVLTAIWGRKKAYFSMSIDKKSELQFIKELVEEGKHAPVIDKCFPLDRISEAHAYTDGGHKKGNVVISVSHDVPSPVGLRTK
jgi:NADPH2:quinone reductase